MSASYTPVLHKTLIALGTIIPRRFIGFDGDLASEGATPFGVTLTDGVEGDAVGVTVIGTAAVEAGGPIAAGAACEVGPDAKAITQTAGALAGYALAAAAEDGDVIELLLVQAQAPEAGPQGEPGPQGEQGLQGDPGLQGAPGIPLLVTVTSPSGVAANRFVGYDGDPCAAGEASLGVAEQAIALGEQGDVTALGVVTVEAGDAISAGGAVQVGVGGKAVPLVAGSKSGRALTQATLDGDLIQVLLIVS